MNQRMMTSFSKTDHKASLKMLINFYRLLLSKGKIKIGGSANKRLKQLQSSLNDQSTKD